jgi:addiction module HigA family antidote
MRMARIGSFRHPGRVLREEYMEPARLDPAGLARALDVEPGEIAMLVAAGEPLSPSLALRLARCFSTTPQFWLALQSAYDLAVADRQFGAEIEARVRPLAA